MLRKLNKIGKKSNSKINKPIKYEAIIKILDSTQTNQGLPPDIGGESQDIRNKIL